MYKKLHESKEAANSHIAKIKARDGEVKQSVQNGKILLEYSFPSESKYVPNSDSFPLKGQVVKAGDVDYDMVSYFARTNRKLVVTLKNGNKVSSTVGKFYNDLVFGGKFPIEIEFNPYAIQLKQFKSIKIVD